ncbi:MAG: VOC family protein [Actinomycetota bacterium]|nr:VOC family protein [Actinomycetota bacterium]
MAVTRILAQMTVVNLASAVTWYSRLFGREPDAAPMDGLFEWHLANNFGVQVWAEAERAGQSTMVLDESDLDAFVEHLNQVGILHPDPLDATSTRILPLVDPDGNRVVITGPFRSKPGI